MKNRPISIAIIAWLMIVTSVCASIIEAMGLHNPSPQVRSLMELSPIPISWQYIIIFAGLVVRFVSGIAILNRQNWARFLYVIWGVIGTIIGLIASPAKMTMIPGVVLFIIVAIILFRSSVNDYFIGSQKCLS